MKPAPRKADADHVFFDDGSVEEIDTIIYCTGYDIAFPSSRTNRSAPGTTIRGSTTGLPRLIDPGCTSSV